MGMVRAVEGLIPNIVGLEGLVTSSFSSPPGASVLIAPNTLRFLGRNIGVGFSTLSLCPSLPFIFARTVGIAIGAAAFFGEPPGLTSAFASATRFLGEAFPTSASTSTTAADEEAAGGTRGKIRVIRGLGLGRREARGGFGGGSRWTSPKARKRNGLFETPLRPGRS